MEIEKNTKIDETDLINGKPKKKQKGKFYVDPTEFKNELINCREKDVFSAKLYEYVELMARKIQAPFSYPCEEDREDVRHGAIMVVLEKWRDYDITRPTSAFSYFTSIIYNGLFATWNSYKKNNDSTVSLSVYEESV